MPFKIKFGEIFFFEKSILGGTFIQIRVENQKLQNEKFLVEHPPFRQVRKRKV